MPRAISTNRFCALSTGTPEEIAAFEPLAEGAAYKVQVNAYERNAKARKAAIQHHGLNCGICGFSFADTYGRHAEKYIQVHHLVPLASIGQEYRIDPPDEVRAMLSERKASPEASS